MQGHQTGHVPPSGLPDLPLLQDGDMSTQLARMLKQVMPEVKPILEVNAQHPLVKKLEALDSAGYAASFDDLAQILFDQALLAEGGLPEDPAAYVKRVNALLV
jgi:molecular chaperone HtpG